VTARRHRVGCTGSCPETATVWPTNRHQLVRLPCLNSLPLTLSPRRAPLGRAACVRPRRGAKSPDVFRGAERPLEKKACCRSLARIRPAVESRGRARDLWPSATGKVGARAAGADLSPAPPPLPRPKLSSGSSVLGYCAARVRRCLSFVDQSTDSGSAPGSRGRRQRSCRARPSGV
jgi:hypothetical protein